MHRWIDCTEDVAEALAAGVEGVLGEILTPERTEADVEKIVELLELEPGAEILDCPCGHGRIANATQ